MLTVWKHTVCKWERGGYDTINEIKDEYSVIIDCTHEN